MSEDNNVLEGLSNYFKNTFKNDGADPDFVNEEGYSWWLQKIHLNEEKAEILTGKGYRWFYVENEDASDRSHVVLRGNDIVHQSTNLESVGVFLDCMLIAD